jgi:hypothetical protein
MQVNKLSFGMCVAQSGQKTSVANADPVLIVNSTAGKFTITSPVSKALGVEPGDYVEFINNIPGLEAAIASRDAQLVAFCTENGIDIETAEGQETIIREFGVWGIAKGHQLFDRKGKALKTTERFTADDKKAFIAANAQSILAENREALIERLGNPDATDEELIASIKIEDIPSPEIDKYQGSKLSNPSGLTGIGVQCVFTDSNIWATLKKDLDNPKEVNRVYSLDVNAPQTLTINDGYKDIDIKYFELGDFTDEEPSRRNRKNTATGEEEVAE